MLEVVIITYLKLIFRKMIFYTPKVYLPLDEG